MRIETLTDVAMAYVAKQHNSEALRCYVKTTDDVDFNPIVGFFTEEGKKCADVLYGKLRNYLAKKEEQSSTLYRRRVRAYSPSESSEEKITEVRIILDPEKVQIGYQEAKNLKGEPYTRRILVKAKVLDIKEVNVEDESDAELEASLKTAPRVKLVKNSDGDVVSIPVEPAKKASKTKSSSKTKAKAAKVKQLDSVSK